MSKSGTLTGEGYSLAITGWTVLREVPFEAALQATIQEGGFGGWFVTRDGLESSKRRLTPQELEQQIIGVKCGWLELAEEGRVVHRKHVYPSGSNFVSYLLSPQTQVLEFTAHEIAENVLGILLPRIGGT